MDFKEFHGEIVRLQNINGKLEITAYPDNLVEVRVAKDYRLLLQVIGEGNRITVKENKDGVLTENRWFSECFSKGQ